MNTSKFLKKTFIPGVLFILGLLLGFFIARSSISRIHVTAYNSSVHVPAQDLEQMRSLNLTSSIQAGPFFLAYNETNHNYVIMTSMGLQPTSKGLQLIAMQTTEGETTTCNFNAKNDEACFSIEYDKGTTKIRQMDVNIGGIGTPPKYTYQDEDGDGRFDLFFDFTEGVLYKRNGLQWVKFRDIQ